MSAQVRVNIISDILRWVTENDGMRGVTRLDGARLKAVIDGLMAEGEGLTSTTVWYLITLDGTDVALINQRLREMHP